MLIWYKYCLILQLCLYSHHMLYLNSLSSSQLIINTAIVYMHRFYMIHSFSKFHRNVSTAPPVLTHITIMCVLSLENWLVFCFLSQIISQTTLFLAAKVEEQPRKLEHVIKIAHACVNPQEPALDTKSNVSQIWLKEKVYISTLNISHKVCALNCLIWPLETLVRKCKVR